MSVSDTQTPSGPQLPHALAQLRNVLRDVRLPLPLPGAAEQSERAHVMANQLSDYVLPRLSNLDAPLLVVVGGSTGAGKSTLVNSLLGRQVSKAGALRPTTRSPVLVHNPADAQWFSDERILPGLSRTTVSSVGTQSLQLVAEPTLPAGLALLDAPDIDSVVSDNRALAAQLLESADMWLFVTTAARYADAVPWTYLHKAVARGAVVAVVCDRVPPEAMKEVPADLGRLMSAQGLGQAALFIVPETPMDPSGLLPDDSVASIRGYLAALAADSQQRRRVVVTTLGGAIGVVVADTRALAASVDEQARARADLMTAASGPFIAAEKSVATQSADGTLLRGEVLARWQEYVGVGGLTKFVDDKVSRARDRLTRAFRGGPSDGEQAAEAASTGLQELIIAAGQEAADQAAGAWLDNPFGRPLLNAHPELAHTSSDFRDQVGVQVRDWQGDVLDLVRKRGRGKRRTARIAAAGVNGVGAAVMLLIFVSTAGLTGAELGVAGGSAVVAQKLLESIFGDDAVRKLAAEARQLLDARVRTLLADQLAAFTRVVDEMGIDAHLGDTLRDAAGDVDAARRAAAQPDLPMRSTVVDADEPRSTGSAYARPSRADQGGDDGIR